MDKEFLRQIDKMDEWPSPSPLLDDDLLICECFCVSVRDIREYSEGTQVDLEALGEALGLGRGCQSCLKRADDWMNKIF